MQNGKINIKIIGIGGGGGNAVNHIALASGEKLDYVAVNTDIQALNAIDLPNKLQIGSELTRGFGSGAKPDVGCRAAEESYQQIKDMLEGTDLVFIAAGLGGGTGTGASPIVAKAAKECNALTIAVVTKPFSYEGKKRSEIAEDGLAKLRDVVDTVICIPNDKISCIIGKETLVTEAFRKTDEVLNQAVTAIKHLITTVGIVNIDYGDISTVISEPGETLVGYAEASGENYAVKAARYAMTSPFLERNDIIGAKQVLISIVGGFDLTMKDVEEALACVHKEVRDDVHLVFGVTTQTEKEKSANITIIATGLPEHKKDNNSEGPEIKKGNVQKFTQDSFDFLPAETGMFAKLEPTFIDGINYDTPTFIRKHKRLLSDAA